MTTTIAMDQAGRIVIPKSIRDQYGFTNGTKFMLRIAADHSLELTPVDTPAQMEQLPNGWLVFHSDLPPDFDIAADIARERQDRDERVAGRTTP